MAKVTKAKEYAVLVPNKVGSLALLLRELAEGGVNILALSGKGKGRKARIRFVPADAAKTNRVLKRVGLEADRNDVLLVELPDKPGSGARLAEALAEAGVNLDGACGVGVGGKARVVLRVADPVAAARVIRKV